MRSRRDGAVTASRGRRAVVAVAASVAALALGFASRALLDDGDPVPRSTNIEIEQRLLRQLGATGGAVARCSIAGGKTRDAWSCDVLDAPETPKSQSVDALYLVLEDARGKLSVEPYPYLSF